MYLFKDKEKNSGFSPYFLFYFLRIGYTLLLFARVRGVKICVFRRKILILHLILRCFISN